MPIRKRGGVALSCGIRSLLCYAVAALLAAALHVTPAQAIEATDAARTSDAQRLTFLLEYVGTDYADAVRDGTVVNDFEYGEVLRYIRQLKQEYGARPRRSRAVSDGLSQLEQLMTSRAPADEVWALTRRLLPELRTSVGGVADVERIPNLARGRRLWLNDCAICHGESGAGDGPAASGMEPPPTAFRAEFLERLSPRQVFDAVSLGVAGTAMPSFEIAYDEAQRWDVAFFTMTLRVGFEPVRPSFDKRFGLAELSDSSNAELLAQLRRTRSEARPEHVDWFRVNLLSPQGQVAPLAGTDVANAGGLALALQMQDAFASVAERLFPRVVGVAGYVRDPAWTDERLRHEHGDGWMAANADALRYPGFRRIRTGSGLLMDDDGYVLTGDHLVRDDAGGLTELVEVELHDETRIVSAVVGAEPMLDLAVLRLPDTTRPTLPALELGDSDRLETGHWLIALGDPPGPERTFAVGLVAMPPRRQCYQAELSATRLQSSLVMAPGGLGGPVVDILGQVVGLSVRQQTGTGEVSTGILPINLVSTLFEALKVARSNRSPWIGVSVLELPEAARRLASREPTITVPSSGVYIDDVFDPSPADDAGVRPGDFLVALGGHPVRSVADFQTWLYVAGIDTKVELELVRDGQTLTIPVVIQVRPPSASTN
jgi:S1-C subfamily serine protease/mono/diheme cytochrome c family protein